MSIISFEAEQIFQDITTELLGTRYLIENPIAKSKVSIVVIANTAFGYLIVKNAIDFWLQPIKSTGFDNANHLYGKAYLKSWVENLFIISF